MNFVFGCFVDTQRLSLKTRARGSYLFLTLLALLTWIWGLVLQIEFNKKTTTTKYDWVDPGFARAVSSSPRTTTFILPATQASDHRPPPLLILSGPATSSGP